jgi:predicted dienelactone hydrolase
MRRGLALLCCAVATTLGFPQASDAGFPSGMEVVQSQAQDNAAKVLFRLTVDVPGKTAGSSWKGEYLVRCGDRVLLSGTIDRRDLTTSSDRLFEEEVLLPADSSNMKEITWRFRGEVYDSTLDKKFEPAMMSVENIDDSLLGIGYDLLIGEHGEFRSEKRVFRRTADSGKTRHEKLRPFQPLTGPFAVGTRTYFWIDRGREEMFTTARGDKRHLIVQVWYPAETQPDAQRALYVQHPELYGTPLKPGELSSMETNAVLQAPLSAAHARYPVILYSHGFNANMFSATFLTEQLASHGYVVFSISHTFFNDVERFPDGYQAVRDFFPTMEEGASQEEGYRKFGEFTERYTTVPLVEDTKFVIRQIEELERTATSFFHGRLDLERMGIGGWSMGGWNAASMCNIEARIRAGINYDGTVASSPRERGVRRPFMLLKSELPPPVLQGMEGEEFRTMIEIMRRNEREFIEHSEEVYRVSIPGAKHTSFSDYPLYDESAKGSIDTQLCHRIVVDLTLAFFNRHVLDQTAVRLEEYVSRYPMISLESF